MKNQIMEDLLSDTLGKTESKEQQVTESAQVANEAVATEQVEQAAYNGNEAKDAQEAPVEDKVEAATEVKEEKVEEQPVEAEQTDSNEQPQVQETAWYESEPGQDNTQQSNVDYTERFNELNIDLQNPETVIQAIETAKSNAVPEEMNTQVVKDFAKYINDGGDIKEFMDTYVAMDVSKMENRDVFKEYLKTVGVGNEELNDALKDFDEMPKYKQTLQTQRLRAELQQGQQQKLAALSQRQEASKLEQQRILEQTQRNVEQSIDNMVGQDYKGLKLDGNMAKAVKNEIINNFTLTKKDGSPDVQKLVDIAIWLRYGQDLVKANVTQAINKGKSQVLDKLSNPSSNPNQTAPPQTKMSSEEFAADYFTRGLLGRNRKK